MDEAVGSNRGLFTVCFLTGTPSDLLGLPNGFRPLLAGLMLSRADLGGRPSRFLGLPVTVFAVVFAAAVLALTLVLVLVLGVSSVSQALVASLTDRHLRLRTLGPFRRATSLLWCR